MKTTSWHQLMVNLVMLVFKYLHGENIQEHVKSLFSLDKIREMLKADKFSEEAEIRLGTDMPLSLTLNMVTGDGKLSFLLAPRLEQDD